MNFLYKTDRRSRILQSLLVFVCCFIMSSIASKMGADGSKGLNPYAGRGVNPITWKEFIYTIPDSFLISIIFSLLFYLFISLGNKKNEQEKESEKNNE